MDQVKKIGTVLNRQKFWIICGLITIMPVGSWFSETSSMNKTAQERQTLIDSKFKEAQAIASKENHPNETAHEGMDRLIEKLKNEVGGAWRHQYDQQKNLLVWPEELGQDFIDKVKVLTPIEKVKFPTPTSDELNIRLRELYRNYIRNDLPKLAKIIDAHWLVQEEGAVLDATGAPPGYPGAYGSGSGVPGSGVDPATGALLEDTSKVNWRTEDQQALFARYDWRTNREKAPRTIDVLYAQEDLWVMTALMQIIAETNQGASARYNSVVKDINYINLGKASGGKAGMVMRVGQGAGFGEGGMGMGSGMDMGMGMGMGMEGSGMGMSGSSAEAGMLPAGADAGSGAMPGMEGASMDMMGMGGMGMGMSLDPAEGRYVDSAYQPVSAATLREAIESDAEDEAQAYLLVAKRMPIRLGLTIDQRKVNRFITACGNSKLMVEVRQVRFNPQSGMGSAGTSGGFSGMSAMGMGGMGMGAMGMGMSRGEDMGMSGSGGGFGSSMMGAMSSGSYTAPTDGSADLAGNDKPVEIFGVVYLYNTVDVRKLKLEEKTSESGTEATSDATANAATSDAGATAPTTPAPTPPAATAPPAATPPATETAPAPASATAPAPAP